jgi:DNA-binding response OmpR family regulator
MKRKSTILIVDDEPNWRTLMETLLKTSDYNLVFAENGAEGLDKAKALILDLVLTDVTMPVMNGFEFCRRLRQDPVLAEVPIVMITSLDDHESRLEGIEAGVDDFINKPFDGVELRARVKTITNLNRYRRALTERSRFEWVVEHSYDGYLMIDDEDKVVYANSQARVYLDVPLEEYLPLAETFLALVKKHYQLDPQEAWAAWPGPADEPLQPPLYLVRPETPTSNAMWLQVSTLDAPASGDMNRMLQLRDITAQVVLRRDTWKFHSMVLHKLRTPLGVMLTSLELMADNALAMPPDKMAELAQTALRGVQRLRSQVKDVTDYLVAPSLAQEGEEIALAQVGRLVVDICAELKLQLVAAPDKDNLSKARITLSQQAAELALRQILENSKKFHPTQTPAIDIALSRVGPRKASLRLGDNGLTLSPEQLARVWIPYYQGEKYFTGEAQGMGLGLSTVFALVSGVGGSCRLHNQPTGPGVVVELILPLADE